MVVWRMSKKRAFVDQPAHGGLEISVKEEWGVHVIVQDEVGGNLAPMMSFLQGKDGKYDPLLAKFTESV